MTQDTDAGVRTLESFLTDLGSAQPTPGGGSASALVVAVGMELASMVAHLTVGRPKYAEHEHLAKRAISIAESLRDELLALMAADEAAFASVGAAFALPVTTPEERAARLAATRTALVRAMEPPLSIMRAGCRALVITHEMAQFGNRNVASDAACAAIIAEAGVRAAGYNVRANAVLLKEGSEVESARDEMARYEAEATASRDATLAVVRGSMGLEVAD